MPSRSLRSKIFILVAAILLAVAAFVMLVTQRDVTRTVRGAEAHAVANVMELVIRDTDARWGALLHDKFNAVRNGRRQLIQAGTTIASVLNSYADMAERGVITTGAAKGMARAWVNQLTLGRQRYAFIYDATAHVLASGDRAMIDQDLSDLVDFKGRKLAQALYNESRIFGYGFAIYRWPMPNTTGTTETRYAYFGYFRQWDWVFAVTDGAQELINQVDIRRRHMEAAMQGTLSRLTLAQSGYVFITADDGHHIVSPPEEQKNLLDTVDIATRKPLRDLLRTAPYQGGLPTLVRFDNGDGPWLFEAARFKPLGWTVVAAVPEYDLTAPASRLLNRQAAIFGVALVLALVFFWVIAARIVRPLEQLATYARRVPEQNFLAPDDVPEHITSLPLQHHDEVGKLASSFLFMNEKLRENIPRLMQETSTRERFESELNIARDIQMGLLPVPLARSVRQRVDLYAVTLPAKEVGGDLYDYFMLSDERLCLAVGDVSDKGVPAALFMAITRTLIRATAEDENDPALIIQKVNNRLAENNPNMMFVTLMLAVLDLDTGRLTWANGGHLPLAVIGLDGIVRRLEGRSGPACGVLEGSTYQPLNTVLAKGEVLVGYTDGITDAVTAEGELYGDARMLTVLGGEPGAASHIAQRLLDDLTAHVAGAEQADDITLMMIRRL